MIAYIRGRLEGSADAGEVVIGTDAGRVVSRIYASAGPLAPGDEVVAATATVPVGVVDHERTALLGPWSSSRADPSGPLGLASTPVLLLPGPSLETVATSAADHAGRAPTIARLDAAAPGLGLELLVAAASGAEIVVLTQATGRHLDLVRILGGRAVVALAFPDAAAATRWLGDADLDADIPVPTNEDRWMSEVPALGLESTHHLVQVDPAPAIDRTPPGDDTASVQAVAAAGVLAGRIAAGNRRWRADLEP